MKHYNIHKIVLSPWIHGHDIPSDAFILHVGWQGDEICAWYQFEADENGSPLCAPSQRRFRIVGTGWVHNDENIKKYVGTCVHPNGSLVFHVFEET